MPPSPQRRGTSRSNTSRVHSRRHTNAYAHRSGMWEPPRVTPRTMLVGTRPKLTWCAHVVHWIEHKSHQYHPDGSYWYIYAYGPLHRAWASVCSASIHVTTLMCVAWHLSVYLCHLGRSTAHVRHLNNAHLAQPPRPAGEPILRVACSHHLALQLNALNRRAHQIERRSFHGWAALSQAPA